MGLRAEGGLQGEVFAGLRSGDLGFWNDENFRQDFGRVAAAGCLRAYGGDADWLCTQAGAGAVELVRKLLCVSAGDGESAAGRAAGGQGAGVDCAGVQPALDSERGVVWDADWEPGGPAGGGVYRDSAGVVCDEREDDAGGVSGQAVRGLP